VVDVPANVPAKLSARARVFSTGHGRKTDATDAHAIAVVAGRTPGLNQVVATSSSTTSWWRCGCWPTAGTSSPAPAPAP
jgi:hypothetical protein